MKPVNYWTERKSFLQDCAEVYSWALEHNITLGNNISFLIYSCVLANVAPSLHSLLSSLNNIIIIDNFFIWWLANSHCASKEETSEFGVGESEIRKGTALNYDSAPFVPIKEPFKWTGSFVNVTSLVCDFRVPLYLSVVTAFWCWSLWPQIITAADGLAGVTFGVWILLVVWKQANKKCMLQENYGIIIPSYLIYI